MENNLSKARVTRTTDKRSPRGIRRLGQALIALAEAQLEAEAQAQAEQAARPRRPGRPVGKQRQDDAPSPTGDAL